MIWNRLATRRETALCKAVVLLYTTSDSMSRTEHAAKQFCLPSEAHLLGDLHGLPAPTSSLSLSHLRRQVRQHSLSLRNRLHSITQDSLFLAAICRLFPSLPLVANMRCGLWYSAPSSFMARAYFKSSDGHYGHWHFSTGRLNLHLVSLAASNGGMMLADSTTRGKRFPDSMSKTVPIWCCLVNRAVHTLRQRRGEALAAEHTTLAAEHTAQQQHEDTVTVSVSPPDSSASSDLHDSCNDDDEAQWCALHLPLWVGASERSQIESRLQGWLRSLMVVVDALPDTSRALLSLQKPLRPLWVNPDQEHPGFDGELFVCACGVVVLCLCGVVLVVVSSIRCLSSHRSPHCSFSVSCCSLHLGSVCSVSPFRPPSSPILPHQSKVLTVCIAWVSLSLSLTLQYLHISSYLSLHRFPSPLSSLSLSTEQDISKLSFTPIICVSVSRAGHGALCDTDSYTDRRATFYVQGAADDENNWSLGLTPTLFWREHARIMRACAQSEEECETVVRALVREQQAGMRVSEEQAGNGEEEEERGEEEAEEEREEENRDSQPQVDRREEDTGRGRRGRESGERIASSSLRTRQQRQEQDQPHSSSEGSTVSVSVSHQSSPPEDTQAPSRTPVNAAQHTRIGESSYYVCVCPQGPAMVEPRGRMAVVFCCEPDYRVRDGDSVMPQSSTTQHGARQQQNHTSQQQQNSVNTQQQQQWLFIAHISDSKRDKHSLQNTLPSLLAFVKRARTNGLSVCIQHPSSLSVPACVCVAAMLATQDSACAVTRDRVVSKDSIRLAAAFVSAHIEGAIISRMLMKQLNMTFLQ